MIDTSHVRDQTDGQIAEALSAHERTLDDLTSQFNSLISIRSEVQRMRDLYVDEQARRRLSCIDAPDWEYLLYEDGDQSALQAKAAKQALAGLISPAAKGAIAFSGYNQYTNQRALEIALTSNRRDITEEVAKALHVVLAHVLPKDDPIFVGGAPLENGPYKRIRIVEQTLSEYGSYCLLLSQDHNSCGIYKQTYGFMSLFKQFDDLMTALTWIEQHLFYRQDKR